MFPSLDNSHGVGPTGDYVFVVHRKHYFGLRVGAQKTNHKGFPCFRLKECNYMAANVILVVPIPDGAA